METNAKLLRLAQSLDSLFPIGGYTLSNGLETYAQKNIVQNKESLEKYLNAYLYALTFNDLAFAAKARAGYDVKKLDALSGALKAPYEIRVGSVKQCARFLKIHTALAEYPLLERYKRYVDDGECEGHYCVAMGLFIKEIDVDITVALELYCYGILSTTVNHAVKLAPLSQLDGQKALLGIAEKIPNAVKRALTVSDDELGASGCGFDLRSAQHEKLYSRLYIS